MITRRELLRRLAAATGAMLLPWPGIAADITAPREGDGNANAPSDALGRLLPQRVLGKTGMKVSMLSVGGSHIGRPAESEAQAVIEAAIELGIRTFDTAQLYQNGGSEERYGRHLTPKYREHVQIFTKTMAQDAQTARQHLEGSLRRLKTDYLDLWQLHDVRSPEQAELRVKGVLDVMLAAKASGKVKHIGFSGHATWRAHARVLELTDAFETCLMPVNIADPSYESFILNILPKLTERKMGVLAMKTLGGDGLIGRRGSGGVIPDLVSVADALRFAWSYPIGTLVSGMANTQHLRENAATAKSFVALSAEERQELIARVADRASTGEMEYYKFDR